MRYAPPVASRADVAKLVMQGLSRKDIEKKLGLTAKAVQAHIERMRRDPRYHMVAPPSVRDRGLAIYGLPKEIAQWLLSQVPEGSSPRDVIRSIIVDAYHEETGK